MAIDPDLLEPALPDPIETLGRLSGIRVLVKKDMNEGAVEFAVSSAADPDVPISREELSPIPIASRYIELKED